MSSLSPLFSCNKLYCLPSITALVLLNFISFVSSVHEGEIFWRLLSLVFCRDCIGDSSLAGDNRWAGTFGVNLDFVARCHCSVEFISIEDMKVCTNVIARGFEVELNAVM